MIHGMMNSEKSSSQSVVARHQTQTRVACANDCLCHRQGENFIPTTIYPEVPATRDAWPLLHLQTYSSPAGSLPAEVVAGVQPHVSKAPHKFPATCSVSQGRTCPPNSRGKSHHHPGTHPGDEDTYLDHGNTEGTPERRVNLSSRRPSSPNSANSPPKPCTSTQLPLPVWNTRFLSLLAQPMLQRGTELRRAEARPCRLVLLRES